MAEDRPALEIEITPEMIEAGRDATFEFLFDPTEEGMRQMVAAVYGAMRAAELREGHSAT